MLQTVALIEVVFCLIAWSLAFVGARKRAAGQKKVASAPLSKWGIILEVGGFALACADVRPVGFEKSGSSLITSMVLGPFSVALAWMAARQLGKQWRFEAALCEDHELIQTGPYRWVRHPIYASMLSMLLAVGAARTWWPMFIGALILFLTGTEIRVRAEDRLLSERFQETFTAYRSRVCAYIPFIR